MLRLLWGSLEGELTIVEQGLEPSLSFLPGPLHLLLLLCGWVPKVSQPGEAMDRFPGPGSCPPKYNLVCVCRMASHNLPGLRVKLVSGAGCAHKGIPNREFFLQISSAFVYFVPIHAIHKSTACVFMEYFGIRTRCCKWLSIICRNLVQ